MKTVAVITPCYNATSFIEETARSVALSNTFQTFRIEHVIVDDGSTDHSWNVISALSFPHVKKIRLDKNCGPSAARNAAIAQTSAEYIFCLDADDVLFQNSLFSLFMYAQENHAAWVYGDFLRGDENLSYLIGEDYYGWTFDSPTDVLYSMYKGEHFFQHNCLFSKKAFEKAGAYREDIVMAEDFDLFTRMLLAGFHPRYLPGPLYLHRYHESNVSATYTNRPARHRQTVRELYGLYKQQLAAILSTNQMKTIENRLG